VEGLVQGNLTYLPCICSERETSPACLWKGEFSMTGGRLIPGGEGAAGGKSARSLSCTLRPGNVFLAYHLVHEKKKAETSFSKEIPYGSLVRRGGTKGEKKVLGLHRKKERVLRRKRGSADRFLGGGKRGGAFQGKSVKTCQTRGRRMFMEREALYRKSIFLMKRGRKAKTKKSRQRGSDKGAQWEAREKRRKKLLGGSAARRNDGNAQIP